MRSTASFIDKRGLQAAIPPRERDDSSTGDMSSDEWDSMVTDAASPLSTTRYPAQLPGNKALSEGRGIAMKTERVNDKYKGLSKRTLKVMELLNSNSDQGLPQKLNSNSPSIASDTSSATKTTLSSTNVAKLSDLSTSPVSEVTSEFATPNRRHSSPGLLQQRNSSINSNASSTQRGADSSLSGTLGKFAEREIENLDSDFLDSDDLIVKVSNRSDSRPKAIGISSVPQPSAAAASDASSGETAATGNASVGSWNDSFPSLSSDNLASLAIKINHNYPDNPNQQIYQKLNPISAHSMDPLACESRDSEEELRISNLRLALTASSDSSAAPIQYSTNNRLVESTSLDSRQQLKIVLVGDQKVGKSSIFKRYFDGSFSKTWTETNGVDFRTKVLQLNQRECKLQLWDTSGSTKWREIMKTYFKGAHLFMLVFDLSKYSTVENLPTWISLIRDISPETPIHLIGNKLDKKRSVSTGSVEEYSVQCGLQGYHEMSTKKDISVQKVIDNLAMIASQSLVAEASKEKENAPLDQSEDHDDFLEGLRPREEETACSFVAIEQTPGNGNNVAGVHKEGDEELPFVDDSKDAFADVLEETKSELVDESPQANERVSESEAIEHNRAKSRRTELIGLLPEAGSSDSSIETHLQSSNATNDTSKDQKAAECEVEVSEVSQEASDEHSRQEKNAFEDNNIKNSIKEGDDKVISSPVDLQDSLETPTVSNEANHLYISSEEAVSYDQKSESVRKSQSSLVHKESKEPSLPKSGSEGTHDKCKCLIT